MGILDKQPKQTGQPLLSKTKNLSTSGVLTTSNKQPQQQQPPQSPSSIINNGGGETSTFETLNHNLNEKILNTASNNLKICGNKKATYSFCNEKNENIEPGKKHQKFCHDNPTFETDTKTLDDEANRAIINSVHKNHEEIHLTQLKNLDSMSKTLQQQQHQQHQSNHSLEITHKTSDSNSDLSHLHHHYQHQNQQLQPQQQKHLQLQQQQQQSQQNTGAYAIASSTTLLYITPPPNTQTSDSPHRNEEFAHMSQQPPPPMPTLTAYNTAEKLAAAAAVAVSSAAASVVEIPNFSEELSSMMHNNRMDDIESGKKFDSKINQTHGFTFGEGNDCNKATYTKAACHNSGSTTVSDDDPNMKLTTMSTAFDIKVKQKRACQMKALVVVLGMLSAASIGCIVAFFYVKYRHENELHFNYTQNMVMERASKYGSNKLEVAVLFNATAENFEDKNALANKIQEIVYNTFSNMNKTVEVIELYEFVEYAPNNFKIIIDVELKNAAEFSLVPLLIDQGTIKVAETSVLLTSFKEMFKNVTYAFNLNQNMIAIEFDKIEILFDQKPIASVDTPRLFANSTGDEDSNVTSQPAKVATTETNGFLHDNIEKQLTDNLQHSSVIAAEVYKPDLNKNTMSSTLGTKETDTNETPVVTELDQTTTDFTTTTSTTTTSTTTTEATTTLMTTLSTTTNPTTTTTTTITTPPTTTKTTTTTTTTTPKRDETTSTQFLETESSTSVTTTNLAKDNVSKLETQTEIKIEEMQKETTTSLLFMTTTTEAQSEAQGDERILETANPVDKADDELLLENVETTTLKTTANDLETTTEASATTTTMTTIVHINKDTEETSNKEVLSTESTTEEPMMMVPKVMSLKELFFKKQQDLNRMLNANKKKPGVFYAKKDKNKSKTDPIETVSTNDDDLSSFDETKNSNNDGPSTQNKELEDDFVQPVLIKPNVSELNKNIQRTIELTENVYTQLEISPSTTEETSTTTATTTTTTTINNVDTDATITTTDTEPTTFSTETITTDSNNQTDATNPPTATATTTTTITTTTDSTDSTTVTYPITTTTTDTTTTTTTKSSETLLDSILEVFTTENITKLKVETTTEKLEAVTEATTSNGSTATELNEVKETSGPEFDESSASVTTTTITTTTTTTEETTPTTTTDEITTTEETTTKKSDDETTTLFFTEAETSTASTSFISAETQTTTVLREIETDILNKDFSTQSEISTTQSTITTTAAASTTTESTPTVPSFVGELVTEITPETSVNYLSKKAMVDPNQNEMNVDLLVDSRDESILSKLIKRLSQK